MDEFLKYIKGIRLCTDSVTIIFEDSSEVELKIEDKIDIKLCGNMVLPTTDISLSKRYLDSCKNLLCSYALSAQKSVNMSTNYNLGG